MPADPRRYGASAPGPPVAVAAVAEGWLVMTYYPDGSVEKQLDCEVGRFRRPPLEVLLAVRPLVEAVATAKGRSGGRSGTR